LLQRIAVPEPSELDDIAEDAAKQAESNDVICETGDAKLVNGESLKGPGGERPWTTGSYQA
jgi:hypothetical protein